MRRLGTDYIDLFQLHGFDAMTPIEEALETLDDLVRAGKIRYIGCSNFSGWHLMKSLAVADRYGWSRYVAHQAYYSLVGRDYEWELMPLALGRRGGRGGVESAGLGPTDGQDSPRTAAAGDEPAARAKVSTDMGPPVDEEYLYRVVDALDEVARETGKTRAADRAQLAVAAADGGDGDHRRPERRATAAESRRGGLGADDGAGGQARRGERRPKAYPYWHQAMFQERNPSPV